MAAPKLFSQRHEALKLASVAITHVRENASLGGEEVARALQETVDAIWPRNDIKSSAATASGRFKAYEKNLVAKRKKVKDTVDSLSAEQIANYTNAMAIMGHLYEIGGQMAREDFFKEIQKQKGKYIPGGIDEWLHKLNTSSSIQNAGDAIKALGSVEFEPSITAHPTNVVSLDGIRGLREVAIAVDEPENLKSAIENLFAKDFFAKNSDGKPVNLTVQQETEFALIFLKNAYKDLPKLYEKIDKALAQKFPTTYTDKERQELKLKFRFKSWASAGDKDGNNNVKSEHLLHALVLHRISLYELYLADLNNLKGKEGIKEIVRDIEEKLTSLNNINGEILKVKGDGNDIPLTSEQFGNLSGRTAKTALDIPNFTAKLDGIIKSEPKNLAALDLKRNVEWYGTNFGDPEYRETAEEYTRVVDYLLQGITKTKYSELSTEDREKLLTDIISNPKKLAKVTAKAKKFFDEHNGSSANIRSYSTENPEAITYHSLRRMQLALQHKIPKHNVLAECQSVSNILEAILLQRCVSKDSIMHVVPLVEEPETMEACAKMVELAIANPVIKAHIEHLQKIEGTDKPIIIVQFAQSDTGRRGGVPASRGHVHSAIPETKIVLEKNGYIFIIYIGGSLTDAPRNGGRSATAIVDDLGLHKFFKITFQGRDNVAFFNYPTAMLRFCERIFVNGAKRLSGEPSARQHNELIENLVTSALKKLTAGYEGDHFNEHGLGQLSILLPIIDYDREVESGNSSSRAGTRGKSASETHNGLTKVPTKKIRTIGFTETLAQNGLVCTWLGSRGLKSALVAELSEITNEAKLPEGFSKLWSKMMKSAPEKGVRFTPEMLHWLYNNSPCFRDVVDKMAYGLTQSNLEVLRQKIEAAKDNPDLRLNYKPAKDHLRELTREYKEAAKLVYAATTGKKLEIPDEYKLAPKLKGKCRETEFIRFQLLEVDGLSRLKGMEDNNGLIIVADAVKTRCRDDRGIRRAAHAIGDAGCFGARPLITDPSYAKAVNDIYKAQHRSH